MKWSSHKSTNTVWFHSYEFRVIKIIDTESRMTVPWAGGGGNWKLLFNGYRASVLQDEKSSGDSGDDCTIAWVYLMALNYTRKSGSDSKFYIMCILVPHLKKKKLIKKNKAN